jgi:hypothetical protein
MKKEIYNKTIRVAVDKEKNIIWLEVAICLHDDEQENVHHISVKNYVTLSISGYGKKPRNKDISYGGQIIDELKPENLAKNLIPQTDLDEIVEIWKRWHLNDMSAGCIHQGEIGVNSPHDNWKRLQAIETAKCPIGYVYGSKWLLEPLPADVIIRIKKLFGQTKNQSVAPSGHTVS